MADQKLTFRAVLDDKVSKGLDQIRKKADMVGGKGTAGSLFGNIGAKAVSQGFSIIDRAISGTIGFLGDASAAAAAEEVSIQKLGTSLQANVKDWDGNTGAIEKVLAARMKLGFSDDEQRESLARLVGATRDVNKALDLQRTAMDLARFKGISLGEASEALIRIEGGQFRALKGLIGSTKDITTATEAMAAVQRVAGGAAEDLSRTNSGRLLNSQIKVGEAMEKLGAKILPVVVSGTEVLAGAVEGLAGTFEILNGKLPETAEGYESIIDTLNGLNPLAAITTSALDKYSTALEEHAETASRTSSEQMKTHFADLTGAIQTAADEVVEIAAKTPAEMADAMRDRRTVWQKAIDQLASDLTNSMSTAAEIAKIQAELAGENIAGGLKSKDPIVKAQAEATRLILTSRLSELTEDARSYGTNIGANLAAGLISMKARVAAAAAALAAAITDRVQVDSPAKRGPLSKRGGPEGMGKAIGVLLAKGLTSTMPSLALAANGPGGDRVAARPIGGGSSRMAAPVTRIIQLVVEGKVLKEVYDRESYWSGA